MVRPLQTMDLGFREETLSGIGAINLPVADLATLLAAPTDSTPALDGEEATEFLQLLSGLLSPTAPQQVQLTWNAEAESPPIPVETQLVVGTDSRELESQPNVPGPATFQDHFDLDSFNLKEVAPTILPNAEESLSSTSTDVPDLELTPFEESVTSPEVGTEPSIDVPESFSDAVEGPVPPDTTTQLTEQSPDDDVFIDAEADADVENYEHSERTSRTDRLFDAMPTVSTSATTSSPVNEAVQTNGTVQTIHEHLVREIVQRVEFLQDQEQQQFKMRLDPPELGEMLIKIRRHQGNVAVQLQAVQPATASLIQPSLESLQELLKKHDLFDGGDVAISLFDSENGHDAVQHNVMQSSPHNTVSFRA